MHRLAVCPTGRLQAHCLLLAMRVPDEPGGPAGPDGVKTSELDKRHSALHRGWKEDSAKPRAQD